MCNSCIPKKLGDNTYKMLALQGHNFPLVHTSMFSFSTTQQLLSLMVMGEKSISMHVEGEAAGYNNTDDFPRRRQSGICNRSHEGALPTSICVLHKNGACLAMSA